MKVAVPLLAGLVLLGMSAAAAPLREIEVTSDPPDGSQQVFTLRIKPSETHAYEKMTFECTYRQEFESQATDSVGSKVVNEPASFTYRRKDIKLVDDLDCYVSFRVPMGIAKLSDMFGKTTFNTNSPIVVSRIRITAFDATGKAWTCSVDAKGLHTFAADPAVPAKP